MDLYYTIALEFRGSLISEVGVHGIILHRKLEEQYSKVKDILSEFTAWQSLPQREGLEKFSTVHSSLSSIPSLCSGVSLPQEHQLSPKMSFEMRGLSDMLAFGQLGRLVVESSASNKTRANENSGRSGSTDPEDVPPNRKRKKVL